MLPTHGDDTPQSSAEIEQRAAVQMQVESFCTSVRLAPRVDRSLSDRDRPKSSRHYDLRAPLVSGKVGG